MSESRVRVALARAEDGYRGIEAPFSPDFDVPELATLYGGPLQMGSANPVFRAVRSALASLGLDRDRVGKSNWNPLGDLVQPGGRVVLKPNLIRHFNPGEGSVESVVTHGAYLRVVADYAWLAVGREGSVVIAEAPQQDCKWAIVSKYAGIDRLVDHFSEIGLTLEVVDIRREEVELVDGIIVDRVTLPGDPAGYRVVDLGDRSFFAESGLDAKRFRGADYDPGPTSEHHSNGRNEYLISETVLSSDLVINLPKLKTHKKTGVTLALKNLVGINGDKNWLPHHTLGNPEEGGDEYPGQKTVDRWRSRATEIARPLLGRGLGLSLFRFVRRFEDKVRGEDFIRSGNWHGNQTTWRMCLDLNRCLYYSDRDGFHPEADRPVRQVLTILDGIVAGDGSGPLAPRNIALGAVIASTDPVAVDLAAMRLMQFDPDHVPKVREAMRGGELWISSVREPSDVEVMVSDALTSDLSHEVRSLDQIRSEIPFRPHAGWVGHVEASS